MHFRFKDEKRTPQLSQTKLMVETIDATAGLLVMQNGHPLTPQQRHDEEARLANYVQSPQELRKKKKQEKEDTEHTERILRALPDAFCISARRNRTWPPGIRRTRRRTRSAELPPESQITTHLLTWSRC